MNLRDFTPQGRLPGFIRRRYALLLGCSFVLNGIFALMLALPLDRTLDLLLILSFLTSACVSTIVWILFLNRCDQISHHATTRLGLRCWECGYAIDGLVDTSKCPECGMHYDENSLRTRWHQFSDWSRSGV